MYGQQGYGAPPQGGVSPEIQNWFNMVDKDRSGQINYVELKSALVNGQGEHFSDTACKLMIGMFDPNKTGNIGINEFSQLYQYINQWLGVFKTYDRDQSGGIEENELAQELLVGHLVNIIKLVALQQMGFRFSPDFIKFLIQKSDLKNHRVMSVDQFIVVCVQIQRFTEAFRTKDTEQRGMITIGFEEFLNIALNCTT